MKKMHYNFKDLFRAPRLALSLQRIWINGLGLLLAYVIYFLFSYLSFWIGGQSLAEVWQALGLLPCAFVVMLPWYAMLVYFLGSVISTAVILMTNTAVARVVYMVLRNELFYTWTQAFRFAFKKWISVLGAMLTFIFMIAFFVIGALVLAWLGKVIPYLGEWGTVLMTLPYLFSSVLLFFISIVFGVALLMVPAIIATSDEDALGGVFQSFSITFNHPWRLLVYGGVIGILEIVSGFLFAAFLKAGYDIFIRLFSIGMGDKISKIQEYALHLVDTALPALYNWLSLLPGNTESWIYLSYPHPMAVSADWNMALAGFVFGIFILLAGGMVVAYAEATGNAGLTLIYIILYRMQEKESLLEREDEELKEEEEVDTEQTEEPAAAETDDSEAGEEADTESDA